MTAAVARPPSMFALAGPIVVRIAESDPSSGGIVILIVPR